MKYTLLPGFIANRLQGLRANQNAIQRTVFFRDGMRMFAQSPLVGSGVGSFETGVTGVQDFYYETKYIHNHYIQILLEDGILGFVPFLLGVDKEAFWFPLAAGTIGGLILSLLGIFVYLPLFALRGTGEDSFIPRSLQTH